MSVLSKDKDISKDLENLSLEQKTDNDSESSDEEESKNDPDYELLPKRLVKIKIFFKKAKYLFFKTNKRWENK